MVNDKDFNIVVPLTDFHFCDRLNRRQYCRFYMEAAMLSSLKKGTLRFLFQELCKKAGMLRKWMPANDETAHIVRKVTLTWAGTRAGQIRPSMRHIEIEASKPFTVLVGFDLSIPLVLSNGYDPYGQLSSVRCPDGIHRVVFATFVGRGPKTFELLVRFDVDLFDLEVEDLRTLSFEYKVDARFDLSNSREPQAAYEPHSWQKFGFFS